MRKEKENQLELTDNQVEQIILNKIYKDGDYLAFIIDNFDKRWFSNEKIQKLLELSISYYKKYTKLPTEKILNMLIERVSSKNKDLSEKELELEFTNSLSINIDEDSDFIKETVTNWVKTKSAYFALLDNIDIVEGGKRNEKSLQKCLDKFQKIIGISFDNEIGFDYFKDFNKHIEELKNPESRISTGWKQLDKITHGGFYKNGRCLAVFLGQPGIGKSLIFSNIATNLLKQNKFPLVISLEMSEQIYASRIDSHISEDDINALSYNTKNLQSKVNNFKKLYPDSKLIIKEFPPSSINCAHIQTYIEKLHRMNLYPDVLLVDYINLLLPNNISHGDNTYEKIGNITKELRALSYKFNLSVITGSQLNREGYNTSAVSMSNTSESAGINHHSDFIAALYQEDGDRQANKLNMVILKNRLGGMIGKVNEYFINYKNLQLKDYFDIEDSSKEESMDDSILEELENL